MGNGVSREVNSCMVPIGMDPIGYALSTVHGVPRTKEYLSMYPDWMYTVQMACDDVRSYKTRGMPKHSVPKFHTVLGRWGRRPMDPRRYVFQTLYGMTPPEVEETLRGTHYTREMALKEIAHKLLGKSGFKYKVQRDVRFFNKRGIKYKPGTQGYSWGGYAYSPFGQPVQPRSATDQMDARRRAKYEKQQQEIAWFKQQKQRMRELEAAESARRQQAQQQAAAKAKEQKARAAWAIALQKTQKQKQQQLQKQQQKQPKMNFMTGIKPPATPQQQAAASKQKKQAPFVGTTTPQKMAADPTSKRSQKRMARKQARAQARTVYPAPVY